VFPTLRNHVTQNKGGHGIVCIITNDWMITIIRILVHLPL
jgi:hypothetical protein